ncbi:hypothetical protein G7Y89_g10418 [Cudoniella acicularis]|uniref:Uncharacterized protein n=1 Tax=Cudoniella acicularis TaxID=354080 RepID=A0A8H4W1M7_9HELO|nr:hypothetical protein G7Y89_g10418 [Cudoniella acicularis]
MCGAVPVYSWEMGGGTVSSVARGESIGAALEESHNTTHCTLIQLSLYRRLPSAECHSARLATFRNQAQRIYSLRCLCHAGTVAGACPDRFILIGEAGAGAGAGAGVELDRETRRAGVAGLSSTTGCQSGTCRMVCRYSFAQLALAEGQTEDCAHFLKWTLLRMILRMIEAGACW